jgi:hypothetical protein
MAGEYIVATIQVVQCGAFSVIWCVATVCVTPDFPKETKCKHICMPGSSFMHIVTYK